MLDLPRLERIRLSAKPFAQRFVSRVLLKPNYRRGVSIVLQGVNNVPREPVIFAMNHTDRFNYWPFQYAWKEQQSRYTATWVKGKYYETPAVGTFMEWTNNIPTVSRGYLITKDCMATLGRRPSNEEYASLRALVDDGTELPQPSSSSLDVLLTSERDMLGRRFDVARESYPQAVDALFRRMMARFVELNEEASALGLDLLIFPQGTRSIRLSRGHVGLAQIAMHLGAPIVPVGCNGSDKLYPGSSPVARPGTVVYRIGKPITRADAPAWVPSGEFVPFSRTAERDHRASFQAYVDAVMDRIDGLLDPEYRRSNVASGHDTVSGSDRFV